MGDWLRAKLPTPITEFVMFVVKMGWASLFGGLLLIGIIVSSQIWQSDWPIARYDALVGYAVTLQILFLLFRLETLPEAKVILLFHLTGTIMEVFKLHMGSWDYPEASLLKIAGVPLFSGFMYASVGSFMARAIRLFDMRFAPYPSFALTLLFAGVIYLNFFTHHFMIDLRVGIILASIIMFWRTRIWFEIGRWYWMPLPLAAFFSSFFLWIAENIGTLTKTWLYSGQTSTDMVNFAKMGSWYMLLYVAFVTVTIVVREPLHNQAADPR